MSEATATDVAAEVAAVRSVAGVFRPRGRGLLAVTGEDRVRWLDGMLTNDLTPPAPFGCYALLLTPQGRIVADLHVLARADAFWLELSRAAVGAVVERFDKHIIADDVAIVDLSDALERVAVEGPASRDVLESLAGRPLRLEPGGWEEIGLGVGPVNFARFGWSGEDGYQLLTPLGTAEALVEAVLAAGSDRGVIPASHEALEILRIEAGIPAFGAELDDSVLPAEAGLLYAVSQTKGCYVGQEVVARMQTAGRASHLLVGLELSGDTLPDPGSEIRANARKLGEVTSCARSPSAGPIALGFVRSAAAQVGSEVEAGGVRARIRELPFAGLRDR